MSRPCPIPDRADLEFARSPAGTVHICKHIPESWERGCEPEDVPFTADALVAYMLQTRTFLCGRRYRVIGPGSACWVGREDFADDDFCAACIHCLGGGSWRAFDMSNVTAQERG